MPSQVSAVATGGLDARTPVLLLPARIETRFVDSASSAALLVRIYPDQISVDTHEPELTSGEVADAQAYWNVVWRAGKSPTDDTSIRNAWGVLVAHYHAPRTAWIVLQTTPTNLPSQPSAPTPPDKDPVPAPAFPFPTMRSTSWNRAGQARLLPDRWTVVAQYQGGSIVQSTVAIQTDLAVTLDPSGAGVFPLGSTVDAGMQWMVDFDAAVKAGMALSIPLNAGTRASGFDSLFVYGVRSNRQEKNDSTTDLQALLEAHHYSDGLSFVPQGAPTKNTADMAPEWKVSESQLSYPVEQLPVPAADPQNDGSRAAVALGLPAAAGTFDRIAHAFDYSGRNAADMLIALWPATIGYFLQQMMWPVLTFDQIDLARQWTIDHVVARGPLAPIRMGKTPYALLPTSSLRFYPKEGTNDVSRGEAQLVATLQKLLAAWTSSVPSAPHFGAGDPDQDLLHVLGMDASSMVFDGREVLGQNFVENWQILTGLPDAARLAWWQTQTNLAAEAVARYGSPAWHPFILGCSYNGAEFRLRYPTVTDQPLSETLPLVADAVVGSTKMNYIDWLRTASADDITLEKYPGGAPPTALQYKLLRQSLMREYANIASNREIKDGRLTLEDAREPELVNVAQSRAVVTPLSILARPMPDHPSMTWTEFLVKVDATPGSPYAHLGELRTSLQRLASLPTAELDRLFTETLDLCSYRLDAWLTAVAAAILQRSRANRPNGLYVGGYGWVENVRPSAPRTLIRGAERETVSRLDTLRGSRVGVTKSLPVPLEPLTDNGGFIHAPSYQQASAAAVLRAGYMTHKGTSNEPLLSIDLSSKRVQRALWVLDGVRNGQGLSALLGYRFEEELDANGLQVYVQPFRDRFPMIGSELTPTDPAAESVRASNVVDALALRAAFDAKQLVAGGDWGPGLPPSGSADQNAVIGFLGELDDIMDAISDLSISEAVFQVMRGNFERAGGLLDAVTKGTYAPDPQVVDTQRSGVDLTHRVMALFAGTPTPASGWNSVSKHARARMEPSLDAWAGTLLPNPTEVRCSVSHTNGAGVTTSKILSLADLDIGPLDFLALANADATPQRSELEQRIRFQAGLAPDVNSISIAFAKSSLPANSITFPEALMAARSLRELIGAARPVQPGDLCETQVDPQKAGGAVLLSELQSRLAAVLTKFNADLAALQAAASAKPAVPATLRPAIFTCSVYGITGAIPATSSGTDDALVTQGNAVAAEMAKRSKAVATIPNVTAADALAIAKTIFNGTILVLPRLTPPNAALLHQAFAASSSLIPAADADAPSAWIQQLTHVRPAISYLDAALTLAQLLIGSAPRDFAIGQLPFLPSDRWLALGIDPSNPPPSARVSLVALPAGNISTAADYAGLLIDEWPERIPAPKQSAAVSFHYEEPKSRAPQALLLAVCPDGRATWGDELLLATLEDTLQLAKIRTVDLDSIIDVGHILPALYVPMNLQQATIATRFRMTAIEAAKYNAITNQ
jgi:hypothetical protein